MKIKRWPAEWEPHAAMWLSWPHNPETWPGHFEPVPRAYSKFVRAVADVTHVRLLAASRHRSSVESLLSDCPNLSILDIETNDCWIRDYGPTFVIDDAGTTVGIDWRYNAWGGKYEPWDDDATAAKKLLEQTGIPRIEGPLCLEGGAIETNGDGIVLTTPECILSNTRNPGLQRAEAEEILAQYLGAREIVWVTGGGLVGDDTDGHIDQLARFVSRDHLVCAVCDDPADENFEPLERNFRQLTQWGELRGIGVSRLPVPRPRWINGQRVPECYCNFLITNGRVLLPTFADPESDERAMQLLCELMPRHEILPINASDLVWGLGAFHCASQQQCRNVIG